MNLRTIQVKIFSNSISIRSFLFSISFDYQSECHYSKTVIGSNTNSNIPYATSVTDKMKYKIAKAVDASEDVVLVHNHPGSSIPSYADIESLIKKRSSYGVVVCHDGGFYTFKVVGEPAVEYTLNEEKYKLFLSLRTSDKKSKLLKDIERTFGVRIEHHT